MIWSDGFTASYYVTIVDPYTWRDIGRMEITEGAIDRTPNDLMQSADITMKQKPGNGETWIRVWLDAEQEGIEHVALFTGLTTVPERSVDGMRESFQVDCYSVLKPIDDIMTERGFYIPAEVNAVNAAARLLRSGPAPVIAEIPAKTIRLAESIVAEEGETKLTMAQKVLAAIGWRTRIDGAGTIYVEPDESEIKAVFNSVDNDSIEPQISDKDDWFSCPNVLRVIAGDLVAVSRDDDPKSELSTVSRGREIWAEETSATLGTNESIGAYAIRRLGEIQAHARTIGYSRRFDPSVFPNDLVQINHPEIDIDGTFKVTSQQLTLSHGCRVEEEAIKV